MNYEQVGNKIVITGCNSFDIRQTLECGQWFRYTALAEGEYRIVAFSRVLNIRPVNGAVELYPCSWEEFESVWMDFFDLSRDYDAIKKELADKDEVMREAVAFGGGIRILNQDIWECLISFIISQNNRIPRIMRIIRNIAQQYGGELRDGEYSFPTAERLRDITVMDYMALKTGFRAKYIADAVEKFNSGEINIFQTDLPTTALRGELMRINGVGPKVANCVLVFSCRRRETFPIDVWVKRVMEHFYFDGRDTRLADIEALANERFGELAGYAQQYLFHYARQLRIGA